MYKMVSRTVMSVVLAATGVIAVAGTAAADEPGWRIVYRLPLGDPGPAVNAIAAVGPQNAWAVGGYRADSGTYFPLLLRWNGTSWSRTAFPADANGVYGGHLEGADASALGNVWAHGTAYTPTGYPDFVSRWDGTRWRTQRLVTNSDVYDLEATGRSEAWMVGLADDKPFFRRYSGGSWRNLPSPGFLQHLSVISADNVWGVGPLGSGQWVARWNGKSWAKRPLPKITPPKGLPDYGPVEPTVTSIQALGPGDIWVTVGFRQAEWSVPGMVLLRWDGKTWRRVLRTPDDLVGDIAKDGVGGLWLSVDRRKLVPKDTGDLPADLVLLSRDLVRIHHGTITRRRTLPSDPGVNSQLEDLEDIPGTSSLWGAGLRISGAEGAGFLLKYGR